MEFIRSNQYFLSEVLVFLKMIGYAGGRIILDQLVQDKICMQWHNQTMEYCQHIDAVDDAVKNDILRDASKLSTQRTLADFFPLFLWSILVGTLLDRFVSATRVCLTLSAFGDLVSFLFILANIYFFDWSPYWALGNSIQPWLGGSIISFVITIFRYNALSVEESRRSIKFAFIEASTTLGIAFGSFANGQILRSKNPSTADHPRTYEHNFFFMIAINLITYVLIFSLKKLELTKATEVQIMKTIDKDTMSIRSLENDSVKDSPERKDKLETVNNNNNNNKIFSLRHFIEAFACLVKRRPNHQRLTLFVAIFMQLSQLVGFLSLEPLFFQFSQKVYNWSASKYSTASAISKVGTSLFLTAWLVVLVKKFQIKARTLILTGIFSYFCMLFLLGVFPKWYVYFIAIPVGSFSGLVSIGVRVMVASIVGDLDLGKIFALLVTFETAFPFLVTLILNSIFAASIDTNPGLIYQCVSAFCLFAFFVFLAETIYTRRTSKENNCNDDDNNNNEDCEAAEQ